MGRYRQRIRRLERRLKPQDPTVAVIRYHTQEECDRKIAQLPPHIKRYVCLPYECATVEEWQAEVRAEAAAAEERRREVERDIQRWKERDIERWRERDEHPDLRLIEGSGFVA
jgi:hypothetical protein